MRRRDVLLSLGVWMLTATSAPSMSQPQQPLNLSAVDRRLRNTVKQTQFLHLYGAGRLWNGTTRLSGLQVGQGVEVRDRRLINALLGGFRCTDRTAAWDDMSEKNGYVHVDFMGKHGTFLDHVDYINPNNSAYDLESRADGVVVPMKQGSGPRFEAYVRDLAKRLRKGDPGVAVWNIDAS